MFRLMFSCVRYFCFGFFSRLGRGLANCITRLFR